MPSFWNHNVRHVTEWSVFEFKLAFGFILVILSVTPNYTLSRNNPFESFCKSVVLCYRSSSLDQKNSTSSTTEGSKTQDSGQTSNNQGRKGFFSCPDMTLYSCHFYHHFLLTAY